MSWLLKADSLIDAFEVLVADDERMEEQNLPGRRISSVAYMLAGFAVENLLKGKLITTTPHLDDNGKFILGSHYLVELSENAGYQLGEAERRLLERMQEFSIWAGRYPMPISSTAMQPRTTPEGGFAPRTCHNPGEDWHAIRALFARFREDLLLQLNKGTQS